MTCCLQTEKTGRQLVDGCLVIWRLDGSENMMGRILPTPPHPPVRRIAIGLVKPVL